MRLTKSFVDKLPLPPRTACGKAQAVFYRDAAIPGFGLRVTSGGAKSFIVEKRVKGKVKRMTLGRYGNLTVEQARTNAMQLLAVIASNGDPLADRKQEAVHAITLQAVFDDYVCARKDLRESTVTDYRRCINTAFPDWLNKPLKSITKDKVELRHFELGKKSHARANNTMRVLRALYNHARKKYENDDGSPIFAFNPVDRISHTRGWYHIPPRRSILKPHEIKPWYEATQNVTNEVMGNYLQFLLFTGLRRSEAARLRWSEIDFVDNTINISDTKNGLPHTLPITAYLYGLLRSAEDTALNDFVFPAGTSVGYLTEPRYAMAQVIKESGIKFQLHDLRRTFITMAESLDIPAYALKQLINHKDPNDVTRRYIITDVNRIREPMDRVSDYLLSLIYDNKTSKDEKPL